MERLVLDNASRQHTSGCANDHGVQRPAGVLADL